MSQDAELEIGGMGARYLAVFTEPDAGSRRAAVADLWTPDATEFVHEVQFHGHEELEARVIRAHDAFVATGTYTVEGAGDVTRHDDIVMFTAPLVTPAGAADWTSRLFLLLYADGRIKEDYQLTIKPLP